MTLDLVGVPEIDQNQTPLALAIKRMNEHAPSAELFREVAALIPQIVPDVPDKPGWGYGSCRVVGRIGGVDHWSIENGLAPSGLNLSEIDYIGIYRQVIRNKHTGKLKYFCATIPLGSVKAVSPGETIEVKTSIPFDWKREEVEAMARESFLKLQEFVTEFYNREDE